MKDILMNVGLTEGESEVYTILVEQGLSSAGDVFKKSNLASSKVYEILFRLVKKGLSSFILKNNVKYYDATPPERLLDILEEKKQKLTTSQAKIKSLLPLIHKKRKQVKNKTHVVLYEGKEGPKIVLKEALEAGKRGALLMGFGTNEDPYKDFLPYDINDHLKEMKKHNIGWKLLFSQGKWKSQAPNSEIRFLPQEFTQPIRTMIYGNKVALVDFTSKPWLTIIFEKEEIVKSYTNQFNFLWKIAKK
jgi:sugar-specific transcriptional regulator TrmB